MAKHAIRLIILHNYLTTSCKRGQYHSLFLEYPDTIVLFSGLEKLGTLF